MGKFGFLFEVDEKKDLIIFIEKENIFNTTIIGFKNFIDYKNTQILFLNKNLELKKHSNIEKEKIRYAKIVTNDKKIVDVIDLLFWFPPKIYQELYLLFTFREYNEKFSNAEVIKRANSIHNIVLSKN